MDRRLQAERRNTRIETKGSPKKGGELLILISSVFFIFATFYLIGKYVHCLMLLSAKMHKK